MRYNTGVTLLFTGIIGTLILSSWGAIHCYRSLPATPSAPQVPVVAAHPQTYAPPAPVAAPVTTPQYSAPARALSTAEVRTKIDAWLNAHPDRNGQMQLKNILPSESFGATAIRFQEPNASRWSDNSTQWSQIKLDLNRDGVEDEKWLLKNGHTWKRETLNPSGGVASTEYFK